MSETITPVKYSGADWMEWLWKERSIAPSPLGIKVADILGQVFAGIYHIQSDICSPRIDWQNPDSIQVRIYYGEFSTFDSPKLTILLLCCIASNINCVVGSSSARYCRFTFSPGNGHYSMEAIAQDFPNESMADLIAHLPASDILKKTPDIYGNYSFLCRCRPLEMDALIRLVQSCHANAIRAELRGRSPIMIQIYLTQRKRTGRLFERHPDLQTAIEVLYPYWSALCN